AELLGALGPASGSGTAAKDREHLALLDTMVGPEQRDQLIEALRPLADDPELAERAQELYAHLDDLAEADPADPRVAPLAEEFAAYMPDELVRLMSSGDRTADHPFGEAFLADFAPAQAEVVRRMIETLVVRTRGSA
ncbi:MerR family transcriptional regulator, partial [Streptomyces sp. T-3]|nr:MerR family transcriptional regulator [Streptomyces sp. T-3]